MTRRLTLGILSPFVGGFYHSRILRGAQRAAHKRGVGVVAFQTTGLDLLAPAHPEERPLAWESIDGWIGHLDDAAELYERIAALGKPLVLLSSRLETASANVLPDNTKGTLEAVRHLLDHGHTRVAFAGCLAQADIRERYEAYQTALRERGIVPDPALFFHLSRNQDFEDGEVAHKVLGHGAPFTALMTATDLTAMAVLKELKDHGRRVPDDVALVSFDDIEAAQNNSPPIASVRQSFEAVSARGAELLLDHLLEGRPFPEQAVRVPTMFVRRESCGCSSTSPRERGVVARRAPDRRRRLVERILREAADETAIEPIGEESWPGVNDLAAHVEAIACGRPGPDRAAIRQAWHELLGQVRDVDTLERVLTILEGTADHWRERNGTTGAARAAFRDARELLRFELLRAIRTYEQHRNRHYQSQSEANRKVYLTLTGSDFATIHGLHWLRWTPVRFGCLALGRPANAVASGGSRRLAITGSFEAEPGIGPALAGEYAIEQFPAGDIAHRCLELDPSCLVKVIPITAHRPEHGDGLLVTAGPLEPDFYDVFGHLGQWGALLGAAMDRKHLVDELQKMALHDALTGLPNRSLLMDRLEQAIARAKRDADFRFAVLFLDLDRFKTINDSLGHLVGDELLVMIADRLRGCLRATDTVARLGGDEFALVVTELADPEDAELVARRVHAVLEAPFEIGGHRVFTSGSIGIALGSETMGRAQDFLRDADIAMYRAKNAGRARHELFDAGMHAQAITRLRVEADLRRALERGELFLEYQPVVDLPDCGVGGVEALIRWRHPEQGIVPPLTFLPIADETGLIVPISQWVVATACRQAAAWRAELGRPVRVHVNVPSQQLKDPGFADSVAAHLASAGIGAEGLGIELVESSLIENGERTDRLLARLREMGVPVAIDDFGTGYSSLAYLKRFPVDAIKIDRSLLHGAPADANDNAICSAIVAMARSLRLRVVAEGVERREQLDFLRSLGCSGVQGYLFSRPLPAAACKDVLRAGFLRPPSSSERALRPATSPPPTE